MIVWRIRVEIVGTVLYCNCPQYSTVFVSDLMPIGFGFSVYSYIFLNYGMLFTALMMIWNKSSPK